MTVTRRQQATGRGTTAHAGFEFVGPKCPRRKALTLIILIYDYDKEGGRGGGGGCKLGWHYMAEHVYYLSQSVSHWASQPPAAAAG